VSLEKQTWQPVCALELLHKRAEMLAIIRDFFKQRNVLEVETPLLCQATGTDPQLHFFTSFYQPIAGQTTQQQPLFLQSSPEFAMKRLLAAGCGSIYQICKAFRNGESGIFHNPEFTLLEWYRVGFTLDQLINETVELINCVLTEKLTTVEIKKISYCQLFQQTTGLDPLSFSQPSYQAYAESQGMVEAVNLCGTDHSLWLDYLFSFKVQTTLKNIPICIVYGYPAIQASLARINPDNKQLADRFEIFMAGVELANGFFELADADEQAQRFEQENYQRTSKQLPPVKTDQKFIAALREGLPECCGVAVGLDRLLMTLTGQHSLNDVIAFPYGYN